MSSKALIISVYLGVGIMHLFCSNGGTVNLEVNLFQQEVFVGHNCNFDTVVALL